MSQSQRFTSYPPAQKRMSRRDPRMVSNVSARKKWLHENVPEWNGSEIWSEKQVKRYIADGKKERLPLAKRVKIPIVRGFIIPIYMSVLTEFEAAMAEEEEAEEDYIPLF